MQRLLTVPAELIMKHKHVSRADTTNKYANIVAAMMKTNIVIKFR
jgi:hypothetical protein